jgi:alanine dehydrogenase
MKFALIKERKNPPDRRVVLAPAACEKILKKYPDATIKVEHSEVRAFTDDAYKNVGCTITDDVSDCDVLFGVKEVPIDALIPNKKYFFFSHTIKHQPYNRKLLRAILDKNIELFDHEVITNKKGIRVVAFGRYAGIVGAYNGFRAYGLKSNTFQLPKAGEITDQKGLIEELKKITLSPIKIVLTGKGRVGNGAREMLVGMHLKEVTVDEFLHQTFNEAVFVQIDVLDYNIRKDGKVIGENDFFNNPAEYKSNFMRFAKAADFYIVGHYWDDHAPYIFTKEDAKSTDCKIKVIADISCDINGPIVSTIRSSTIEDPIYGYHPQTEKEVDYMSNDAIAVMAVDNLPCELPNDSSVGFGNNFLEHVIPAFFNGDKDGVLERGLMTKNGKLTERFSYLQDYVDGKE